MKNLLKSEANLTTILFDLDGTLVNSDAGHEAAYLAVLREHCPEALDRFSYDQLKGRPTREAFRHLGLDEELAPLKQLDYRRQVARGDVPILPGAFDLLEELRSRKHRLFLVTGASREGTDAVLRAHNLDVFFEGLVVGEDTNFGKPDPAPYLACLRTFQLEAKNCIAIEDSGNGLTSALAAGLRTVYVQSGAADSRTPWNYPSLEHFLKEIKSYG